MSNERNIVCELSRKGQVTYTRRYKWIDTAVARSIQVLLQTGEPGDVLQVSHYKTGLEFGSVKVGAGGRLTFLPAQDGTLERFFSGR